MSDVHEHYIKEWMQQLKVDSPWGIVVYMVNTKRNFDTAVAVMFGLSWSQDLPVQRAWLRRASDELKKLPATYPGVAFDAAYLYAWSQQYIKEVEALPNG